MKDHVLRSFQIMGLVVLLVPLSVGAMVPEVQVGDDAATVEAVLGVPKGYIRVDTFSLLYFERGTVELRDGRVTEVSLVSEEEAKRRAAAREDASRLRNARLREEGLALKKARLDAFMLLSETVAEQHAFWKTFRRRYPMVPLSEIDMPKLARLAEAERVEEQARQREIERENELWRLEQCLAQAEERARQAERDAQLARDRAFDRTVYYQSTPWVYSIPQSRCGCVSRCTGHGASRIRSARPTHPRHSTRTSLLSVYRANNQGLRRPVTYRFAHLH